MKYCKNHHSDLKHEINVLHLNIDMKTLHL